MPKEFDEFVLLIVGKIAVANIAHQGTKGLEIIVNPEDFELFGVCINDVPVRVSNFAKVGDPIVRKERRGS